MEKLIRTTYNDEIVYPILRWILTNGNKCLMFLLSTLNVLLCYCENYNDGIPTQLEFINILFSFVLIIYLLFSLLSYYTFSLSHNKYSMLIFKSYLIEENIREIETKIRNNK